MTSLILLAAGQSERFGPNNKLLANYHGQPLVCHTASRISEGWQGHKIAVTSNADIKQLLSQMGWHCVDNPDPQRGQASSLVLGVEEAQGDIVIALADMPDVSASHILSVSEAIKTSSAIMSLSGDILLPPAAFSEEHRDSLLALKGDTGAKSVFLKIKNRATVPLSSDQRRDIDNPTHLNAGFTS